MKRLLVLLVVLVASCAPAFAAAGVGTVSRAVGLCTGTLNGQSEALAPAAAIFPQHRLSTGAAARLEITFDDATLLTLGENAKLTVSRFVYDPGRSRALLTVVGAMRFIAARRAGAEITVQTPVASIGVRGTDFWSGPIDGQYGVLLLDGEIVVASPAGTVVLDEPGEGVSFAAPGAPPGAVTLWPQDKVQRALAAVTFP